MVKYVRSGVVGITFMLDQPVVYNFTRAFTQAVAVDRVGVVYSARVEVVGARMASLTLAETATHYVFIRALNVGLWYFLLHLVQILAVLVFCLFMVVSVLDFTSV